MKSKISRRSFLRNIAAAGSGAAALGLLAGCSSSSTAASSGSTAAAEDKYTPAPILPPRPSPTPRSVSP